MSGLSLSLLPIDVVYALYLFLKKKHVQKPGSETRFLRILAITSNREPEKSTMLGPKSVLITGANRGIGLEFVKAFLNLGSPPKFLFAGCRNPESAKVYISVFICRNTVTG